ncbi:type I-F CRISPR-associated protein Csy1 [bacterium]|nr:type I-F CRISPR-associated protein Csy1 [bacterium]
MNQISSGQVKEAIAFFLEAQLAKKLEPEEKALDKANNDADASAQDSIREKIIALKERYSFGNWFENDATKMTGELKFGTHISRGIHPRSKGDNVNFRTTRVLPEGLVGSQSLRDLELDASGNAAALPLASFFNTYVDEPLEVKLRDLIVVDHPALEQAFSNDIEVSSCYLAAFKAALLGTSISPCSDAFNKQLLWPVVDNAKVTDVYKTLVPLHPSALVKSFYRKINGLRYSVENMEIRRNRGNKAKDQRPYFIISKLGVIKLGGENQQNVSLLNASQGGRNLLLPSMPPSLRTSAEYRLGKNDSSIFNKSMKYQCRSGINELYAVIKQSKNTVEVRDQRKYALDIILAEILVLAENIRQSHTPGWSKDYQLDMAEKYWLDPSRASLEGEERFAEELEKGDWANVVERNFSLWLNGILKATYIDRKHDFADAEYREWRKNMRDALKASQRLGQGVST